MDLLIKLIVFLPLFAAIFVGLNSRALPVKVAQVFTVVPVWLSAIFSGIVFYKVGIGGEKYLVEIFNWVSSGNFKVDWALRVDSLTAVMLVVVNVVSAMVHLYSIGYMSHDPHPQRFMSYLSLFTFFMLMLVTSDNFLQLFLGWEGVGLCSYLLIGFWYKKPSANAAAMKAFIVNRVGDIGLALGVFTIYLIFGTINFNEVFGLVGSKSDISIEFLNHNFNAITLICVLLFVGAMGKSAQFGLHTWLPDAMEGPTPVSALIHAATMVTAGVFLVARCSPLFEYSDFARDMVTVVGAFTALFAATIAITQNDIKRVIAYSTCSQLGYMFFACGVSAYSAGIFHLMTHGFFKALLFLGAGSVIHAMSDEQDMRKMGGIWKKIPFTYLMMIIGTIAIVGLPPFSGYYSKDMILESAYAAGTHGNILGGYAYWVGIVAATLTAFYSWRLIFMTFHGKSRASNKVMSHIHESPIVMTLPLFILAVGAVAAGYVSYTHIDIVGASLEFWNGAVVMLGGFNVLEEAHHVPVWAKKMPLMVGVFSFILAWLFYIKFTKLPGALSRILPSIYSFLHNKWYIDELYDILFVRPVKAFGQIFWKKIDVGIIDRFGPNGMAALTTRIASKVGGIQTGFVYHYAFGMIVGMLLLVSWIFWVINR